MKTTQYKPHAFAPVYFGGIELDRCEICAKYRGDQVHILTLPGCEDAGADRETARQLAEAEELTARMRTPKADVSAKAGRMERESPLFFGTGENPILF